MSDESPNTGPPAHAERHKFPVGNKFGRGNPMARATGLFRAQVIKELKAGKRIPRLMRRLFHLSNGAVPVRLRVKKNDEKTGEETTVQETHWILVDPAVQLNAIKELLNRSLGKATEFKVVERQAPPPRPQYTLEQMAAAFETLGVPEERWPVMVREHRRKKIAATVSEPKNPT